MNTRSLRLLISPHSKFLYKNQIRKVHYWHGAKEIEQYNFNQSLEEVMKSRQKYLNDRHLRTNTFFGNLEKNHNFDMDEIIEIINDFKKQTKYDDFREYALKTPKK